jgi:hypothetical protein
MFLTRFFSEVVDETVIDPRCFSFTSGGFFGAVSNFAMAQSPPSDQDIADAYVYLLGRLHITRQQQLDFQDGFKWNEMIHRKPGAVDWPNPNLDVAYSEVWVAVDESSCTIVSVPKIQDRYFTVQFLNGWGETLANINERVFPRQSYGDFAVCLREAKVKLPDGLTSRIDLPVRQARILARVALGNDQEGAVALQQQFKLTATGTPKLPDIPKTPIFELEKLPGVEAFESAIVERRSSYAVVSGHNNKREKTHQLSAKKSKTNRHEPIGLHMADVNQRLAHASEQDDYRQEAHCRAVDTQG